jgi:hypothetical protein
MVDILSMVDLTSISAILAAIGVFAGVVFAILQLRDLVKTRQTDLIIRLHQTSIGKEHVEAFGKYMTAEYKDFNDFVEKYGPLFSDKPVPMAFLMMSTYFEGIGVLAHRKLVDVNLVGDLFAVSIIWEKMKPLIEGARKQFNEPRFYEWFEYLYNEIQKREQQLATIQ